MPDPGSHAYDVQRTRLRAQYDDDGTQNTSDGKADDAANAALQREHPPVALDRALGLEEGVTAVQLRTAAEGHVVAHGTLVGVVAR